MLKTPVDFTKPLVDARGTGGKQPQTIGVNGQVKRWDGVDLPQDTQWYAIHFGKRVTVVNEFGEERDGKKLIPLVKNKHTAAASAQALTKRNGAYDFDAVVGEIRTLAAEVRALKSRLGDDDVAAKQQSMVFNGDKPSEEMHDPVAAQQVESIAQPASH
jgi:hypothetical protein